MQKRYDQQENFNHETISLVSVLEDLIKTATHRYKVADNKDTKRVIAVHKLKSEVMVDNIKREVELIVKEVQEKEDEVKFIFYNHTFI